MPAPLDSPSPQGITLGFVGASTTDMAERVRAFEDEVLFLLDAHGARVLFRGHRSAGQPAALPVEMHILWFPDDAAFDAYLADPRRAEVIARHGEVFNSKTVVRLDPLT
jgi:uncharacterized protein (DUF1330 family)